MERTAEEFVHRLPDGRWFVGDFVGRAPKVRLRGADRAGWSVQAAGYYPRTMADIEALLLVRDLFNRAESSSRDGSAFGRMLAPLLFDLSVETALKLAIDDLGLPEQQTMKGMLTVVAKAANDGKPMPGAAKVNALREERNQVQHGGTPRSPEAVEKGRDAAEKLLSSLFPAVFGEKFETIGARRLVHDVYNQIALDQGEAYFKNEKYSFAVACAACALRGTEKSSQDEWSSLTPHEPKNSPAEGDSVLAAVVASLVLGYDVAALARFRKLAVGRTASMPPTGELSVVCSAEEAREQDARFALDFASFNCARLERRLPASRIHLKLLVEPSST